MQGSQASLPIESPAPILLVEDNPVNQKVELILLELLGLSVQVANNGKEALALVKKQKFSLILMDCHMPEMDGFEATVAIRKLEEKSGTYTPIIAVTALAMAGDRERCIAAGMDDYLPKPIDKELLRAKLEYWLRRDVNFLMHKPVSRLRAHSNLTVLERECINLVELEEFYGHDQLKQMLELFLSDTKDIMHRLKSFLKQRNYPAVAGLAHELKASCASVSAKQLARLSLYLEQAAGHQDWIEAEETYSSMETSFKSCSQFIDSQVMEKEHN